MQQQQLQLSIQIALDVVMFIQQLCSPIERKHFNLADCVCIFNWFLITKYPSTNLRCIFGLKFPIYTIGEIKMHISHILGRITHWPCRCVMWQQRIWRMFVYKCKKNETSAITIPVCTHYMHESQVRCRRSCGSVTMTFGKIGFWNSAAQTYNFILKLTTIRYQARRKHMFVLDIGDNFLLRSGKHMPRSNMNTHKQSRKFTRTCNSARFSRMHKMYCFNLNANMHTHTHTHKHCLH